MEDRNILASIVPFFIPIFNQDVQDMYTTIRIEYFLKLYIDTQTAPFFTPTHKQHEQIFWKNILTKKKICATIHENSIMEGVAIVGKRKAFVLWDSLFSRFFHADFLQFLQSYPALFTCLHQFI